MHWPALVSTLLAPRHVRRCRRLPTCNYIPKPLNPKPYPGRAELCERPTREVDWGRRECSACSRMRVCIPVALRLGTLVRVKIPRGVHKHKRGRRGVLNP
jgi:hypothetical protein